MSKSQGERSIQWSKAGHPLLLPSLVGLHYMESKSCWEGKEKNSRRGKPPKPGQGCSGYGLKHKQLNCTLVSQFTTLKCKSSHFSQERIQILNVRIVKKVLKLHFKNQKDDSSLKMQREGSPTFQAFFLELQWDPDNQPLGTASSILRQAHYHLLTLTIVTNLSTWTGSHTL